MVLLKTNVLIVSIVEVICCMRTGTPKLTAWDVSDEGLLLQT